MDDRIVFGTMTFGPQVKDESEAHQMLSFVLEKGKERGTVVEIDTAFVYNGGDAERMVGSWLRQKIDAKTRNQWVRVATKVHPWRTGKLDEAEIRFQFDESRRRLGLDSVDLLYLHGPSAETPIEETLAAMAKLYNEGGFKELGLSNFSAWQLVEIVRLCELQHLPFGKPSVFQGMYNGLTRNVEEIFEPCHKFGIRFYAYNPLAGGLLSGRYQSVDEEPEDGRFAIRAHYKNRYWRPEYFSAMKLVNDEAVAQHQCSKPTTGAELAGVAFRWLTHHSKLSTGDAVIIGASCMAHLQANLDAILDGKPLPQSVVDAFQCAWDQFIVGASVPYGGPQFSIKQ